MMVLWLRARIFWLTLRLEYRRGVMYHNARKVANHHVSIKVLKSRLASIDCPRRALRLVAARKVTRYVPNKKGGFSW